jgi:hypothetical protein
MNARKLSASLSDEQYRQVERTRKKLRLGRSQVVQEALALWLSTHQGDQRIVQYLAGYVNHPEDSGEAHAITEAWARGLEREDW